MCLFLVQRLGNAVELWTLENKRVDGHWQAFGERGSLFDPQGCDRAEWFQLMSDRAGWRSSCYSRSARCTVLYHPEIPGIVIAMWKV